MNSEFYYCGLDLGAHRLKACLLRQDRTGTLELLGVSQVTARGLAKNSIRDLRDLSQAVEHLLGGLADKSKVKFKDIHVGLGGHFFQCRKTHAVIPLADRGNKVITHSDIQKINHQACLLGTNLEEKLIHDIPVQYVVDGYNLSANPLGLQGRKLEANVLILVAQNNMISNIAKAIHQSGFELKSLSFSSLSAAQACLTQEERDSGCVFIDMGAEATSILIFKDKLLKDLSVLPLGSARLTEDISRDLNLSFDLAEDIKRSYALVATTQEGSAVKGEILVKRDTGYVTIDRQHVCQVTLPWATVLIEQIYHFIHQTDFHHHIDSGLYVAGGGALLAGLLEGLEKKFSLPTRMAKMKMDTKQLNNPAIYAASIGLAGRTQAMKLPSLFTASPQGTFIQNVTYRLKELYQEYF